MDSRNRSDMASLEHGSISRCATSARTTSRSLHGFDETSSAMPSLSIAWRMAFTCPQGTVDFTLNSFVASQRLTPLSDWRRAAMASSGSFERLATVRFTTLPPTRLASRSRYAGRELRFGTVSMYMGILYHYNQLIAIGKMKNYMGTFRTKTSPFC